MWFPKFVAFIWTFSALTQHSDTFSCPKGHRLEIHKGTKCVRCPDGNFQPEENKSQYCKPCNQCSDEMGSYTVEHCTLESDTKCKCRENFLPLESDSTICECAPGFTSRFRDCVKVEETKQQTTTTTKATHPLPTNLTTARPREGATTQKPARDSTTTPTGRQLDVKTVLTGGIIFLATSLLLTALIYKLNLLSRRKRRPGHSRDASFRTPVEESGDGSQDSLKQSQDEP